jgi:hypothetical protein
MSGTSLAPEAFGFTLPQSETHCIAEHVFFLSGVADMNLDQAVLSAPPQRAKPQPNLRNLRGKTWLAAVGEHEVSTILERLPSGVQFDENFPEPIRYDATKRTLHYRGFMPHYSFVELQKLSNELDYLQALERLFAESANPTVPTSKINTWLLLTPAAILSLLIVGWLCWR